MQVSNLPGYQPHWQTGDKFQGGFGETQLLTADYWTLRARSRQLFKTNLYARGLIRRLVNNEINTGLHLESVPEEKILGLEEDALAPWSEDVESRFELWGKDPWLCDHMEQQTFGGLQAQARMEALIEGDVLVVLKQHQVTQLPRVQLVCGGSVQTPMGYSLRPGHKIVHGVELDTMGRHTAYWVTQPDGTSKRLPAYGEKSGRRLAWLLYGTEKKLDEVRGEPILSLVLQSLREIDRYRDATQRKAVINSMLAMFIKKTEAKMGTRPITGGAVRRNAESPQEGGTGARRFHTAELIPGLVLDELQQGEEPHGFAPNGTDEKFGDFEDAIITAIAWAHEIPPEILKLSFGSNYSASQAAINEFKMYLNRVRTTFGDCFCHLVYVEWLIAQALQGKIRAQELIASWRDATQYDIFGAWTNSDWAGHIKPAVDLSKLVRGYNEMVAAGFITRDRASRELTGTKYSKNVQKLRIENEHLAEANKSLAPPAPPSSLNNARAPEDDEEKEGDDKAARPKDKAAPKRSRAAA